MVFPEFALLQFSQKSAVSLREQKGSVHAPEHFICSLNDFSDALFHGSSSQNRIFRCGLSRDGSERQKGSVRNGTNLSGFGCFLPVGA